MDKIKRREDKARMARQAAIEELQKKREGKRIRDKEISNQEIVSFFVYFSFTVATCISIVCKVHRTFIL